MEAIAGDSGMLLNLSDVSIKKKRKGEDKNENKEKPLTSFPKTNTFKSTQASPTKQFHFKKNNEKLSEQFHFKKKNEKLSEGASGMEHLHTSSLFKSNPEIPSLNIKTSEQQPSLRSLIPGCRSEEIDYLDVSPRCSQKGVSEPLFSENTFEDVSLHPHLVACLKQRLEVVKLTKVQEKTIPILLDGKDALVKSCTGSGKTLAYAVPIVQKLQDVSPKTRRCDGIFSLIVVPTRELALQCFECFSTLTKSFTWIVPGYLIGGEKKKSEKARLRKGINILICTPGRLLDHLDHTACLTLEKIKWLVIDEADRLLEQGFEESVHKIVSKCCNSRQTILCSATLSKGVERLAGMSLTDPVYIGVASGTGKISEDFQEMALPRSLKQSVVVVPSKLRLAVMSSFIVDNYLRMRYKGLIFLCSQSSVDFHYALLSSILVSFIQAKGQKCKFFRLHGNMKQEERTEIFNAFKATKQGILLCTDVAARGLDLPHLDWIMQYSAPPSAEIYVHRVGRTARIGKKGSSLLFLLPSETRFSQLLSQHKIQFEEIDASTILQSLMLIGDVLTCRAKVSAEDCATALQTRYEKEVYSEKDLHEKAKEAFGSYVQSYLSYPKNIRDTLPFKALHLGHVAKSFCLREAPSELGIPLPNAQWHSKPFRKSNDKPQKKKHMTISEYGNGLSEIKQSNVKKPQKRKHMMISEFGSGLPEMKHSNNLKAKKRKFH